MQEKFRYYTSLEQKAKDTCPLLSLEETHLLLKNIIDAGFARNRSCNEA